MTQTDVYDIRRENLRELIRIHGRETIVKGLGYSTGSYLSQVAGSRPTRKISDSTARAIETLMHLPAGCMDKPALASPAPGAQTALAAEVAQLVTAAVIDQGLRLTPAKTNTIVALAYEHALANEKVDAEFIKRLLQLAI